MAAVKVECSACLAQLTLKSRDKLGKKLKCPKCGEVFVAKPVDETAAVDDDDMFGDLGDDMELLGAGGSTGQRKKSSTGNSGSMKSSKAKKSGGKGKKKKSKGQSAGDSKRTMLIAGIGGGVVVVALAIWGVIALMGEKKPGSDGNQTAQNGPEEPPVDPGTQPTGDGNPNGQKKLANKTLAKKQKTAPKGDGGKTAGNTQVAKKSAKPQPKLNSQQVLKELQTLSVRIRNLKGPADAKLTAETRAAVMRAKEVLQQKQPKETAFIPGLYRAGTVLRDQWIDKARGISAGKEPLRLVQTIWERSKTNDPIEVAYAAYTYELLADLVQAEATPPEARRKEADKLYTTAHDILKPIANTNAAYRKKVQDILIKRRGVRAAGGNPVAKKSKRPQPGRRRGGTSRFIIPQKVIPPEKAMAGKLSKPLQLTKTPLTDALRRFADLAGAQIVIDHQGMADEGIPSDTPVSATSQGIAGEVLSTMLKPLQLTWTVRSGVVYVTTITKSEEILETRMYQARAAGMMRNRIMNSAVKTSWLEKSGVGGTMSTIGGDVLLIRQTYLALRAIENQFRKELKPVRMPEYSMNFSVAGMKHPTAMFKNVDSVSVIDQTLKDGLSTVCTKAGLKLTIDMTALKDEGISADLLLNFQFRDLKTSQMLELILEPLGMTWVPQADGSILFTTVTASESKLFAATHRIDARIDGTEMTDAIQNTTSGPWFEVEGVGGTLKATTASTLEVRQTYTMQLEIARLLAPFRKSGK